MFMMNSEKTYIKVYNPSINQCGSVDCGCNIVKVEAPYITIELCDEHATEFHKSHQVFEHCIISPMVDIPGENKKHQFRHIHLAAIPEDQTE